MVPVCEGAPFQEHSTWIGHHIGGDQFENCKPEMFRIALLQQTGRYQACGRHWDIKDSGFTWNESMDSILKVMLAKRMVSLGHAGYPHGRQ
jgi:hypothetical protein